MKKILKIAILALSSIPLSVQAKDTAVKGYEIYNGEYISTLLLGDISHDYIGEPGGHTIAYFHNPDESDDGFFFLIYVHDSGKVDSYFEAEGDPNILKDLIDWEASKLNKPEDKFYYIGKENCPVYFKRPLKVTGIGTYTKKYLSTTSPAQSFAGGYDGFIPSFYYTSISGNKSYFQNITSLSSLITGQIWKSGDVSTLGIENNGFIIQNYYVYASVEEAGRVYDVWLRGFAKSKDGEKVADLNVAELVYVDLNKNKRNVTSYDFIKPVATLETKQGYYDIIRSGGAYGLTDSIYTYEEGYKDGQGNPTFKTFIVSAFEACGAFFALPVLGKNITIGTLIGSFIGLGALFLIIRLFR